MGNASVFHEESHIHSGVSLGKKDQLTEDMTDCREFLLVRVLSVLINLLLLTSLQKGSWFHSVFLFLQNSCSRRFHTALVALCKFSWIGTLACNLFSPIYKIAHSSCISTLLFYIILKQFHLHSLPDTFCLLILKCLISSKWHANLLHSTAYYCNLPSVTETNL